MKTTTITYSYLRCGEEKSGVWRGEVDEALGTAADAPKTKTDMQHENDDRKTICG